MSKADQKNRSTMKLLNQLDEDLKDIDIKLDISLEGIKKKESYKQIESN